ncbi:MAG: exodeoxyribonuclease V subunit alpha, partial [Nocardioides sp.]|nr:exodeoxyribonuclease V subunit alpha [Nocardioides sp.]
MTELFEPTSERDRRLVTGASGLLGAFNQAGVVEASDVHVASRLGSLGEESDETVLLAVALTVRAVRRGSVCLDLATVPALDAALPWPDPAAWARAVAASPLTAAGVLRLEHGLLYLDRYHRLESQVCDDLVARAEQHPPAVDEPALAAALERLRDP